jgi:protein-S-isoprenylcysteine O-methyltransferase Ste14
MPSLAKLPPPLALVLSIGAAAVSTRYVPGLQAVWFRVPLSAGVVALSALALIIWAWVEFRRHRTTILPLRQPTRLLCAGPFRFSRNPIYLGMLLGAFAPWLGWGYTGLLLAPPLFFVVINGAVIPYEEAKLQGAFGEAYAEYCRRVRRWC